jgi:hypothetical protein
LKIYAGLLDISLHGHNLPKPTTILIAIGHDKQEQVQEVEKANTEVAAAGREFGDITMEEEDGDTTSCRANWLAQAGYEPENTNSKTALSSWVHLLRLTKK